VNEPNDVHFIGIGGIGMSALARILLQRGATVAGSSDARTPLTDALAREGARVCIGHDAAHLRNAGLVVASSAIDPRNPELRAARERGVPVVRRGALLARLMAEKRGIAIAGTHGKTTTTAMVARVLEAGGLDPSVAVGGERVDTGSNARSGAGAWFVSEADESDGSFLELHPEIAVLTNLENDHIDSDDEMPRLVAQFADFLASVPAGGLAVLGTDDPRIRALAGGTYAARARTFGFANADLTAADVRYAGFGSRFVVRLADRELGAVELQVPGAINVLDALPAIAIGLELGVSFGTIAAALAEFRGVRRRFEILTRGPRMTVVDDYAHHPTAVAATIAAARDGAEGPLIVAFQPHRYSRTRYLAAGFVRALAGADRTILTDVYAASESPLPGVDAELLAAPLRAAGADVLVERDVRALPERLLAEAPPGALVLMLGAGSISGAAHVLAARIETPARGSA